MTIRSPAVNKLAKQVKAGTGGFITGPAAIDGVATAIRRAKSTQGIALAAQLEKFRKVPTLSGLVSFTPSLHSVFGRQYRVIRIQDNKAQVVGSVVAKVVPKIWRSWQASRRRRTTNGGPETRSGPPESRGPSRACRRSPASTSSSTTTRSWG